MLRNRKGFTFLTLVLAMVIVGLVFAFGNINISRELKRSNIMALRSDISLIQDMSLNFYQETGQFPATKIVLDPDKDDKLLEYLEDSYEDRDIVLGLINSSKMDVIAEDPIYSVGNIQREEIITLATKYPLEDYVIIMEGEHMGKVVHRKGIEGLKKINEKGEKTEGVLVYE